MNVQINLSGINDADFCAEMRNEIAHYRAASAEKLAEIMAVVNKQLAVNSN